MKCVKRKFRDRIAAMIALAEAQSRDGHKRQERRAYRCDRCRAWHLTSRELIS